ncbi:malto-oligosyltrehalose synthase [Mycobacterium koreense]|uniref:Malto-oligosyltrehalose synthase n=1 Tax=Mycolicibacillus koreensis TaxID=1069220 RepID=A0A7I7S9Z0_9MYCO|nr:malto-oligosyltrehalose synthase [Mycolicibacillus koreensis]MCV7248865.1 malto-oligosyltrehalose synthase [Mycolicibacillus koreensis]OSC36025.1 malto-oligosyltrehalose synthase [Mycolicibacillus koreensis]BBY53712.1 putative maltooligosyl trehalose synthase [Mycolicibacillus koreensis]
MITRVLSTYRLQLRGADSGERFDFDDAAALVDYLDELGVSHLYLSPILTAVTGSSHGYDVTDPTCVSPALGGPDGLARLSAAARARGMGLIVDIVPNHLGVGRPEQNRWWWDVLRAGRGSPYAAFFDIDWDLDGGRIVLPVLGSDSDAEDLRVDGDVLRLGERCWPIAEGTGAGSAAAVHDRQHYRLVGWRRGICGYRRFFSITDLAALRQEDPEVFDACHAEVARWFAEDLVDGVRIDHPDGLTDPVGYLRRLRALLGPRAWIVIEKILAADEALEPTLPIAGTTGYDALRLIGGVFVDPAGAADLTALAAAAEPEPVAALKTAAVSDTLASELDRLRRTVSAEAGTDDPQLAQALAALVARIGVYRCDYPGLAAMLPTALAHTAAAAPRLATSLAVIATALAGDGTAGARLQQLCGAATAKAVEDCLFYRDARLVSLNEVGGDPQRFGVSVAEFHHANTLRARHWPQAMTTLSTHDTKRGEDVRARISVLSQMPRRWAEVVRRCEQLAPSPAVDTGLFLWQNLIGVWPPDGPISATLRERLRDYARKAAREADRHTGWADPDEQFETALTGWLDRVIDGPAAAELTALATEIAPHAASDGLAQKLLALTVPGIPDVYQGTELWEDSLVDPDNRRPVDFAARRRELGTGGHPKLQVVRAALAVRRRHPRDFTDGDYRPVLAAGDAAAHLLAFRRGADVLVAVPRLTVRLAAAGWADTALRLPAGTWTDAISGARHRGTVAAGTLFATLPAVALERTDG